MKQDLRDLTHAETRAFADTLGVEPYRGDQIFRWVHARRVARVEAMTDLAKDLRARVADAAEVRALAIDAEQVSRDGTRKLRLRTDDGRMIETVLIPDGDAAAPDDDLEDETAQEPEHLQHALFPKRPKLTQCVSSQVGCALDCSFCATAKLGFGRQLSAGEIVDQVYRAQDIVAALDDDDPTRRAGSDRVTNLVFMGMGEPLHNFESLKLALDLLLCEDGPNFSHRHVTVSTSGLVPQMRRLGEETQVKLAVSLNATSDAQRDALMPLNRRYPLEDLLAACRSFPMKQGRRITFEYVLLGGVNDADADAERLAALLRGIPAKVNLIAYNANPGLGFDAPAAERVARFRDLLVARNVTAVVRKNRGRDIAAACGQLAAEGGPGDPRRRKLAAAPE
jgi:23S rRNA (adenine2503-C2)-methyltransferase